MGDESRWQQNRWQDDRYERNEQDRSGYGDYRADSRDYRYDNHGSYGDRPGWYNGYGEYVAGPPGRERYNRYGSARGFAGPYRGFDRQGSYGSWGRQDYEYGRDWRDEYDRSAYGRDWRGHDRGWLDRAADEVSSWFGNEEAAHRRRMDEMQAGHRGRGPKGYTRSDERIREDVSDRLMDDPIVDASEVEVSVSGCEVTLTGTVDTREQRRRAEDCADRVSGVTHVQNNLRVKPGTAWNADMGSASTSTMPSASRNSNLPNGRH